jgi:hypothetical protein
MKREYPQRQFHAASLRVRLHVSTCARVLLRTWPSLMGVAVLMFGATASAQQTVGGGTIDNPAQGPPASFNLGEGAILVKNWDFGTNGTITSKAVLDTHFQYHDQFNKFINGGNKYGAQTLATSASTAISGQKYENSGTQVRQFFADSMRTYLVPLDGAAIVSATAHNVGCGSVVPKWKLPAGGSLLGQDIIWETRVRFVPAKYFWFGIWVSGNVWLSPAGNGVGGAEIDLVESFGYENPGGYTNFDGSKWHSASVGGFYDTAYTPGWNDGMSMVGAPNPYDPTQYHIWTLVYRADDTFSCYVDGIEIQNGRINWTYGATEFGDPINMTFLLDGAWGHTQVAGVNKSLPASELSGKYYEWDYSRVYLRPSLKFQAEQVQAVSVSSGDSVDSLDDAGGSGFSTERFNASGANDFVTYTLPNVPAGTYAALVGGKTYYTRGRFQLSIDGANQGGVQDLYGAGTARYPEFFLGNKTFGSTGNRAFKFTVTGKNPSSTDYDLSIDYIHLLPVPSGGSPTEVTMDSEDSGKVELVGKWNTSKSVTGYIGVNYRHDGNTTSAIADGMKRIRYRPKLTAAGNYQVYLRWTSGVNRATNVPVDITHGDGTVSTVTVNQEQNGGQWVLLGTYPLSPGVSCVTIRNTDTNGLVVADGVRFTPVGGQVTMDSQNTPGVTVTGSWTALTSTSGYQGNILHDGNVSKGSKSVKYTPALPASGNYLVEARWTTHANRATNVPIDIMRSNGTITTVTVNQQQNNGVWVSLGTHALSPSNAYVTIRTTNTNGYVIADGVRFTPQ